MPVFFICFIVFILWFRVKSNQENKNKDTWDKDFWEREREADFARKKDISNLNYINIPEDTLPFNDTDNVNEQDIQNQIKVLLSKKILNLSGMSNTDIKLTYGRANFEILSEYDQTFMKLLRLLGQWGELLYNNGDSVRAKQILEYALTMGSDITGTYTTLAKIYLDSGEIQKVQSLIDQIKASDSFMKDSIANHLIKLLQEY